MIDLSKEEKNTKFITNNGQVITFTKNSVKKLWICRNDKFIIMYNNDGTNYDGNIGLDLVKKIK